MKTNPIETTPAPNLVLTEQRGLSQVFTPWLLPWALWMVSLFPSYGIVIAFVFFSILDGSHRVATLPLSFFDKGLSTSVRMFCILGAVIILSLGVVQAAYPGTRFAQIWFSLWIYWGAFHIVRQHYGFLRLYQAKQNSIESRYAKWETWALYSGCGFPYLLNLSHQWIFENEGAMYYRVSIPDFLPWLCLGVFMVSVTQLVSAPLRKNSLSILHIILAVSNFWIGILWVGRTHFYMAALFITSYHNLQYHGIVWQVGQRRYQSDLAPAFSGVRALFRSKSLFWVVMLVGGLLETVLQRNFPDFFLSRVFRETFPQAELFLVSIVASYKYLHYLIDGRIWVVGKDPRLAAELKLE